MADTNTHLRKLVRDLMKVGVTTCPPDVAVGEIARILIDNGLEAVIVLDQDEGHALGVISQKEIVKAYTRPDYASLKAENIMQVDIPQVPPDIPIETAVQIMQDQNVRVLFLMHHSGGVTYPAASLSYHHILRALAAKSDEELHDLGIQAKRQLPLDAFIQKREAARRSQSKH